MTRVCTGVGLLAEGTGNGLLAEVSSDLRLLFPDLVDAPNMLAIL